jgi:putative endonuclease
MKKWTLYILQCNDGTFYTGITNDLKSRLAKHAAGTGAKYTRGRGPFTVLYQEQFDSRGEATRREYAIKQLSKKDKEMLMQSQTA